MALSISACAGSIRIDLNALSPDDNCVPVFREVFENEGTPCWCITRMVSDEDEDREVVIFNRLNDVYCYQEKYKER